MGCILEGMFVLRDLCCAWGRVAELGKGGSVLRGLCWDGVSVLGEVSVPRGWALSGDLYSGVSCTGKRYFMVALCSGLCIMYS